MPLPARRLIVTLLSCALALPTGVTPARAQMPDLPDAQCTVGLLRRAGEVTRQGVQPVVASEMNSPYIRPPTTR